MLIAQGILNWRRQERISDRYGAIHMARRMYAPDTEAPIDEHIEYPSELEGRHGRLVAVVIEARDSYHRGDTARGFYPSTPEVGETICLGYGTVFISLLKHEDAEEGRGISTIGLLPDDGREHDWLDPEALYRLHYQTIDLHFEPSS